MLAQMSRVAQTNRSFCRARRRIRRPPALWSLLVGLLCLAGPGAATAAIEDGTRLGCETLPRLMRTYLRHHIEFRDLSSELRERVAESYLRRLDSSRSLLLKGEADGIRKALIDVQPDIQRGRCERLHSLQRLIVSRYAQMELLVRETVSDDGYEIDRKAVLIIDPEERGFPTTTEERDALYLKLIHFQMANYVAGGTDLKEAKEKLIRRYVLMHKRAEEFDAEDVYTQFLGSFANSLDPHSDYFSADRYEDFGIHMSLQLEGIGAVLSSRDGYTLVEEIVPGGAADLDGRLKPKDRILAVGQKDDGLVDVVDMDLRDVVRLIRGKKGSTVWIAVLRQGAKVERFTADLVRDKINLEQGAAKLRYQEIKNGEAIYKMAVIELPTFYGDKDPTHRQASTDVRRLLEQIGKEGADGLVLDLSRNGGGLLDYAVEISGYFLTEGGIVAVGNSRQRTRVYRDPDDAILYDGPLVVLTSRVTASAGEILAGAIKDYRRGVVVGDDHTFGKGSVQTVIPLRPGLGALKLTTDLFFRPGGASTQRAGVETDIQMPSLTASDELGEVNQPYSLPARSIAPFVPSMEEARELKLGYHPLSPDVFSFLRDRSADRVAENERFAEIEALRIKAAENQVVRIADLLEPSDSEAGGRDGESGEESNTPQLDEALQILVDLASQKRVALH
jgi:carboxyl-terminal processing protease